MRTHVVDNVVPAPRGIHVLRSDTALTEAVGRWVAPQDPGGATELDALGALAGTPDVRAWADQADRHTPVLRTHDPTGERADEVEYHPSYHRLLEVASSSGRRWRPATCARCR